MKELRIIVAAPAPMATGHWRYRGDRMELPLAVDVMIEQSRKSKNVPAGTSLTK